MLSETENSLQRDFLGVTVKFSKQSLVLNKAEESKMDQRYLKVLRRKRVLLLQELPDMEALMKIPDLSSHFTSYERSDIISPKVPSERTLNFIDALERKGPHVYETFKMVLRQFRPDLVVRLEVAEREVSIPSTASSPVSNGSVSPPSFPSTVNGYDDRQVECASPLEGQGVNRRMQSGNIRVEDAGIHELTECGSGPAHHLSHLSYAGREFLAAHLNGKPPERNVFNSFCYALGVDNQLLKASMRSRNPTAYLIQEFSERPEATFDRLEQALAHIGRRDLFEQLWQMLGSEHGGEDYI